MLRTLLLSLTVIALAACANGPKSVAEFWRPISEPNIQMPAEQAQSKLDFDLSQCRCGIFPTNVIQPELTVFQPDQQRLMETSVTSTQEEGGSCIQRPSLVVAECMRSRGWEVTKCSGRMPIGGNGAICAVTALEE